MDRIKSICIEEELCQSHDGSLEQILKTNAFFIIKSDPMMFAACFTPFVMGALIKFGIPFLERITDFSLQAYYPIFDLLL